MYNREIPAQFGYRFNVSPAYARNNTVKEVQEKGRTGAYVSFTEYASYNRLY